MEENKVKFFSVLKRLFICTIMVLFIAVNAVAAVFIGKKEARAKAQDFMLRKGMKIQKNPLRLRQQIYGNNDNAPYYVFNAEDDNGFVIVSGDEGTDPILAYSDKGSLNEESLPPALAYFLEQFAKADDRREMKSLKMTKHAAIPAKITSRWNQGEPYNRLCPVDPATGNKSFTGCVATAMAQIIRYHRWPEEGTTAIPAYTSSKGTQSEQNLAELPPISFDWDNMCDTYGWENSEVQINAVAQLMLYCGQGAQMFYSSTASASGESQTIRALKAYFGYDNDAKIVRPISYNMFEWDNLIYTELAANRPVFYQGYDLDSGGHAFVVDGYDGDGMYHVNWGWGDAGCYTQLWLMSSTSIYNFTYNQCAIIGIQKPDGYNEPTPTPILDCERHLNITLQRLYGTPTDRFWWWWNNVSSQAGTFEYGAAVCDENDNIINVLRYMTVTVDAWRVVPTSDTYTISNLQAMLAPGSYRLRPVSRLKGQSTWHLSTTDNSYVFVEVDDDKNIELSIRYHAPSDIKLKSVSVDTIYKETYNDITLSLNPSEKDYIGPIYLWAKYNDEEEQLLYHEDIIGLPAGTSSLTIKDKWFENSGKITLRMTTDEKKLETIDGTATLTVVGKPSLKASKYFSYFSQKATDLTFYARVKNKAEDKFSGTIKARLENDFENVDLAQSVTLAAGEEKDISFLFTNISLDEDSYTTKLYYTISDSEEETIIEKNYYPGADISGEIREVTGDMDGKSPITFVFRVRSTTGYEGNVNLFYKHISNKSESDIYDDEFWGEDIYCDVGYVSLRVGGATNKTFVFAPNDELEPGLYTFFLTDDKNSVIAKYEITIGNGTGIKSMVHDAKSDGFYYDIQGRRFKVKASRKRIYPGIYIKNGRKILVR